MIKIVKNSNLVKTTTNNLKLDDFLTSGTNENNTLEIAKVVEIDISQIELEVIISTSSGSPVGTRIKIENNNSEVYKLKAIDFYLSPTGKIYYLAILGHTSFATSYVLDKYEKEFNQSEFRKLSSYESFLEKHIGFLKYSTFYTNQIATDNYKVKFTKSQWKVIKEKFDQITINEVEIFPKQLELQNHEDDYLFASIRNRVPLDIEIR